MPKGSWLEYAVSPQEERVVGDGGTGAGQAKCGQLEQLPTSLAPCPLPRACALLRGTSCYAPSGHVLEPLAPSHRYSRWPVI